MMMQFLIFLTVQHNLKQYIWLLTSLTQLHLHFCPCSVDSAPSAVWQQSWHQPQISWLTRRDCQMSWGGQAATQATTLLAAGAHTEIAL